MKMTQSCSARRDDSEKVSFDNERSVPKSDLRSDQAKVSTYITKVGQYGYLSKNLDEPSRLAPFARVYLRPVTSY